MKDIVINNLMSNISKLNKYSDSKLNEIKYGLESIYLTLSKFIFIIIMSVFLKVFKELILFIIAFSILKITSFGLHAKKSWQCWITSVPVFLIIPYFIKNYIISDAFLYFTPLFVLSFYLFAPADTEKRPIVSSKKRKIYKIISFLSSLVYVLIMFTTRSHYLISILFYSLLLESLLINPIVYKLFGLKYNNYLIYKEKGGKE